MTATTTTGHRTGETSVRGDRRRSARKATSLIGALFGATAAAGMLMAGGSASANAAPQSSAPADVTVQSGTADNYSYDVENGSVMWNDYADSNHDYDLDDLWLHDTKMDGESISISIDKRGKHWKTVHAYHGDTKKIYLWNVKKGEKVHWTTCAWDDGRKGDCENHWSQE